MEIRRLVGFRNAMGGNTITRGCRDYRDAWGGNTVILVVMCGNARGGNTDGGSLVSELIWDR